MPSRAFRNCSRPRRRRIALLRDTIRYARMLEGNVRNTGVHACGVIICRDDVSDWVPVSTAEDKETGREASLYAVRRFRD